MYPRTHDIVSNNVHYENDINIEDLILRSLPELEMSTCGMIVSLVLRSCRPMSDTLTPSMTIRPSAASMIRKSASVKDDFPAPVRPTTPIYGRRPTVIFMSSR